MSGIRVYTNELNGKTYRHYARAVLAMLEAGYRLVSDLDIAGNSKAVFARADIGASPLEQIQGGAVIEPVESYISCIDVIDDETG